MKIKITNIQVQQIQERLQDIIDNISGNIEVLNNKEISDVFLRPILTIAIEISDEIYIQTRNNINDVEIQERNGD